MSDRERRIDWEEVKARLRARQVSSAESLERMQAVYRQRALELAAPRGQPVDKAATLPVMVFTLNGEPYGLELAALRCVVTLERFTLVPGAPAELLGVFNHRGRICSVLDLARLLGLAPAPSGEDEQNGPVPSLAYVLLLRTPGGEVGLRVDAVEAIREIASEDLLTLGDLAIQETAHLQTQARYAEQRTRDGITLLRAEALRLHPILDEESAQ